MGVTGGGVKDSHFCGEGGFSVVFSGSFYATESVAKRAFQTEEWGEEWVISPVQDGLMSG